MDDLWHPEDDIPPLDAWCWVTNGYDVWPAKSDRMATGGWTNEDTWEDFEHDVRFWMAMRKPGIPPK